MMIDGWCQNVNEKARLLMTRVTPPSDATRDDARRRCAYTCFTLALRMALDPI